jgi:hypothetical protein
MQKFYNIYIEDLKNNIILSKFQLYVLLIIIVLFIL